MCYMFHLLFVLKGVKERSSFTSPLSKTALSKTFQEPNLKKVMDSSAEEFGSNESGWTKYLGSPSQEEGNYSSGVYDDEYSYYHGYNLESSRGRSKHQKDNEDDDSMASDASSGPSHLEVRGKNAGGCSKYHAQDGDEGSYYGRKQSLGEKPYKEVKGKAGKESVIDHKANKATSLKQKRGKKTN